MLSKGLVSIQPVGVVLLDLGLGESRAENADIVNKAVEKITSKIPPFILRSNRLSIRDYGAVQNPITC